MTTTTPATPPAAPTATRLASLAAAVALLAGCSSSGGARTGTGGGAAVGSGGAPGGTGGATVTGGTGGRAGGTGGTVEPPTEPGVTIIQEDRPGFGAVDGKVLPRQGSTSVTGYTGPGFADGDSGSGKTISWSVYAEAAGTYGLVWRYAFGGAADNIRDARLIINGVVAAETVSFPYTNTWNDWTETPRLDIPLAAGPSFIQLQALHTGGLANFDYLKLLGEGLRPDTPSFSLTVNQNDPAGGTVSYAPMQGFYPQGTSVTLTATASPGYFFQSWTGDVPGATATHTFAMTRNTVATARFLPMGTMQDMNLIGYATVQDDAGTPYLVNGGSNGQSVTAATLEDLKRYLGSPDPYVVSFSGLIEGDDAVTVTSNKTLLGVGTTAHLKGIGLEINAARNVIIRNVAISHIVAASAGPANDAIEITGGAKNIWIDHCELFSELVADKDYYDGLLDIKNAAAFITISWTVIHDHWKASLISSGDEQVGDTAIRVTYHHNYFHDCGSRLPSIRFGKAHVFNNYYRNNSNTGINSRMGAVVKVESNLFETTSDPLGFWDSSMTGYWEVSNNIFSMCSGSQPTTSTGRLDIPYAYVLETPEGLSSSVVAGAGVGKI
jgi:pectate lyase